MSGLYTPHTKWSLDLAALKEDVTLGQKFFFKRSNSQRWLTAEGHLLAVLPPAGGISPFFLKGDLGSTSQHPPQCYDLGNMSSHRP